MTRRLMMASAMLALVANTSVAQIRVVRYNDDRLVGIDAVDVLVNAMEGSKAQCGVASELLEQTAQEALRGTGLKASISRKSSSWFYTVRVTPTTLALDGQCVTSVMTELVAQVEGIPEADRFSPPGSWGSLLVGELSLFRQTALTHSDASNHLSAVNARLRDQVRAIGERIRAANP